jgi:monofunctional glycosyltransferase
MPEMTILHRFLRLLKFGVIAIALLFAASLVWGRFLPLPSTLILAQSLGGKSISWHWVPFERISPHLARAVIASEDQRFCAHWGVDFIELRAVLSHPAGPGRGASTLSMQTAKNLWLWPGRSYIRKALEIPLALIADTLWGKRRMIEVYLNIAEWGDGVFGAEAAAQHYFGKSAAALTAVEAARLAASLPNPVLRDASAPSPASRRVAGRAAGIDHEVGCLN